MQFDDKLRTSHAYNARIILATGAVEQRHAVASPQTQDLQRMLRDLLRQLDLRTNDQRRGAKEAGAIHRGIIRVPLSDVVLIVLMSS